MSSVNYKLAWLGALESQRLKVWGALRPFLHQIINKTQNLRQVMKPTGKNLFRTPFGISY